MGTNLARVIGYSNNTLTEEWDVMLLNEVDDELVDDRRVTVSLKNKTSGIHYSEGDILNLKSFKTWGWAVGMYKATPTKSRKWAH